MSVIEIEKIPLKVGGHSSLADGACAMELVSYMAGERWSDHPECACPIISAFMRSWNDAIQNDAHRDELLKPLLPLLLHSRSTSAVELKRSYLAFDWLARVQAPAWLDLTPALKPHAETLRALAPLTDKASVKAAKGPLAAAGDAAGDAARAAARDAAWNAAGDAAGDAARAAAGDAARDAAWNAAWDAAGDALRPTVAQLEVSAINLIHRMLAVTE
jgi:hypothetical protein